ncbi:MAG: 1-deoxy-D-xylulose-5-phosphate reductoisomerase [Pirellulaceae bacterium]|jgi:1-deoxy-D-xylulose-5-phosphate reductoisomerase
MPTTSRNVAILGSTGSIGRSTFEVIRASGGLLKPIAFTAHRQLDQLCKLANEFRPRWIVATDRGSAKNADWSSLNDQTQLLEGDEGIEQIATSDEVDIVVSAIVGSAGLKGTWAALQAGKTVALANKETLVMAGPLVMKLAEENGGQLLPVDSEHSAVFQAMQSGRRDEIKRVILTASGGPFRQRSLAELANVTVAEALNHPTWDMGPKITIDSATMMNKALEIIEARWLFGLAPEQIDVVIHPQSIVHSMVEYTDGSMIAQMSPPDMKLPIQYALTYPERWDCPAAKMDLTQAMTLEFEPPDYERFPALQLGHEVAKMGGTAGAVLNAANEAAVAQFLAGHIGFTDIVPAIRAVLANHTFDPSPTLQQLLQLDKWAREEVTKWICT